MREVCRQFNHLNLSLDELMAQIELDMHNSPLTANRFGKNHLSRNQLRQINAIFSGSDRVLGQR